jgi:hypothetical protein
MMETIGANKGKVGIIAGLMILSAISAGWKLSAEALKDPNVTVNYHKEKQGPFSNPPIEASNDFNEIIKLIK